jgi:hypothetical protein
MDRHPLLQLHEWKRLLANGNSFSIENGFLDRDARETSTRARAARYVRGPRSGASTVMEETHVAIDEVKRAFLDLALAEGFERAGYVVADLLSASEVSCLREAHARLGDDLSMPFRASVFGRDAGRRRAIDAQIKAVFAAPVSRHLRGHRSLTAGFLEKRSWPEPAEVPLHQDWTFVDESRHRSLNFWCPLEDVDETNGCLWVLPGSHQLPYHLRAPFGPTPYAAFAAALSLQLESVPMRAGQVLIHDHRLLHASCANRSARSRLAAACVVVPEEAQVLHYCHDRTGGPERYQRYRVDEAFFCDYQVGHRPPERYPGETVSLALPAFTAASLAEAMDTARGARPPRGP